MTKRIMLTASGTGGSLTPLLAIVEQIRRQTTAVEFILVGTDHGPEAELAAKYHIYFRTIPAAKLRRYWSWRNISDGLQFVRGLSAAWKIIRWWRPHVVITAGAYVSVPVVWMAKLRGVRILVHQQDVRPGLANRLMAPWADIVTVAWKKSLADYKSRRLEWVGNPVRPEILNGDRHQALKIFQLAADQPTLLVMGGGTGSQYINHLISVGAFKIVDHCQIIHLTGRRRENIQFNDSRYHAYPFLTDQFAHALAIADLVVSRAGMGSITELAACEKPTIFIPLPDSHQEDNAAYLKQQEAGVILAQKDLTPERLTDEILTLLHDPQKRKRIAEKLARVYRPDALLRLTDLVLHLDDN